MEHILLTLFLTILISTVLNIFLKKLGISHIIGYILTGTIISYIYNFNGVDITSLNLIAEFGVVFLMFTIGLEMSFEKIKKMKEILFLNGTLQVGLSSLITFCISHFIFDVNLIYSTIISLAFSLSSTAIVLPYLKASKDIYTPYGEKTTAILIFQDLAVIPILLLITFLTNHDLNLGEVLFKTAISAIVVILFMFTIGKRLTSWLLNMTSSMQIEELFLASVLTIVMGAAILAHKMGFTYSLGAFIAGMIIAETNFHMKVESVIGTYKDLLLGTFFFSVGTKINMVYFISHIHVIFTILISVMFIKGFVVYWIIRYKNDKNTSAKVALSLCQVGEFSFAIFALASDNKIIPEELTSFLILVTVLSMIITPFIVNNIYKLSSYFEEEFYESDKITPIQAKEHVVICGFTTLGRIIAKDLSEKGIRFVIISDDLRHVLLGRKLGYMAYFGHLENKAVLESLKVDEASNIIITVSNVKTKYQICDAILDFDKDANIVLRIDSIEEKKILKELDIKTYIHTGYEVAKLFIKSIEENIEEIKNANQTKG